MTADDIRWHLPRGPWPSRDPDTADAIHETDDALSLVARREAHLLDRVVDLTIERDAYRVLAQQAIQALADLQTRFDRQQERYLRLLGDLRSRRRAA